MSPLASPSLGRAGRAIAVLAAALWLAVPATMPWPDDGGMPAGLYDGADDDTAALPYVDPVALPAVAVRLVTPPEGRPALLATPVASRRPGAYAGPSFRAPPPA